MLVMSRFRSKCLGIAATRDTCLVETAVLTAFLHAAKGKGRERRSARLEEYKPSHVSTDRLWKTDESDKPAGECTRISHMSEHTYGEHISALLKRADNVQGVKAPVDGKRDDAIHHRHDHRRHPA